MVNFGQNLNLFKQNESKSKCNKKHIFWKSESWFIFSPLFGPIQAECVNASCGLIRHPPLCSGLKVFPEFFDWCQPSVKCILFSLRCHIIPTQKFREMTNFQWNILTFFVVNNIVMFQRKSRSSSNKDMILFYQKAL